MKSRIENHSVSDLLQLRKNNMLTVNQEYQRGAVWNTTQQKKLIDSVMRGYPLPVIYLHHKKRLVAGMSKDDLEIIDGQQRINALEAFNEGGLYLFDPEKDDKIARFPQFIKEQPCPWASLNFDSLPKEFQEKFSETKISVAFIETDHDGEARDLFIRLQAGLPLNAQEKRDAWPGGYTEFVLKFAGKGDSPKYSGHIFFKELVAKNSVDRGQVRQLCAQVAMLYFEDAVNDKWIDIGTSSIDDYYYRSLSFDLTSLQTAKFRALLDKVYSLLGNRGLKKLKGHEVIHLVLLANTLMNKCTPSWENRLLLSFEDFRKESVQSKTDKAGEYWENYVQWTMTSSDTKQSLARRHAFFVEKMVQFINPVFKDSKRGFTNDERQIVYYRDLKLCAVCNSGINWDDLEIHHLVEHQHGGETTLDNAVSVHAICHPKGPAAIDFANQYFSTKS